jgi:hypothetical protein
VYRITHPDDAILAMNEPMWVSRGFRHRTGEVVCSKTEAPDAWRAVDLIPSAEAGREDENGVGWTLFPRLPPVNMLDHCRYLGTYVGPRMT